jgi:hypothetical protein
MLEDRFVWGEVSLLVTHFVSDRSIKTKWKLLLNQSPE